MILGSVRNFTPANLQAGVVRLEIVYFVHIVQKALRQVQAEIVFVEGLFEDDDARGARSTTDFVHHDPRVTTLATYILDQLRLTPTGPVAQLAGARGLFGQLASPGAA